jgi:hypothetical protein
MPSPRDHDVVAHGLASAILGGSTVGEAVDAVIPFTEGRGRFNMMSVIRLAVIDVKARGLGDERSIAALRAVEVACEILGNRTGAMNPPLPWWWKIEPSGDEYGPFTSLPKAQRHATIILDYVGAERGSGDISTPSFYQHPYSSAKEMLSRELGKFEGEGGVENPPPDLSRIADAFLRVLKATTRVAPELSANVKIKACPEVRHQLRGKARRRAFMHVGHRPEYPYFICVHRAASHLSDEFLTGLFLHEFGHLATPGGSEQAADQWVFAKLGIVIEYKGALCLEWARL